MSPTEMPDFETPSPPAAVPRAPRANPPALPEGAQLRAFRNALRRSNVSVVRQGLELTYDLAENLPPHWPVQALIGRTDEEVFGPALAQPLVSAKARVLATGVPRTVELEIEDGDVRRLFEFSISRDLGSDGSTTGLISTVSDVTELRERELALTSLMREVSHRSKNLLAIVQSVAMQTAHHSDGVEDFLTRFRGRLMALSTAQDLVTESNWRGSQLRPLVSAQISRLGHNLAEGVSLSGDNPLLRPTAALHIGLALHELGTNALLHGGFKGNRRGVAELRAHVHRSDGEPATLEIEWREPRQPGTAIEGEPRFGTVVLNRIVPLSVGGTATYELHEDEIVYRLAIPPAQFEI